MPHKAVLSLHAPGMLMHGIPLFVWRVFTLPPFVQEDQEANGKRRAEVDGFFKRTLKLTQKRHGQNKAVKEEQEALHCTPSISIAHRTVLSLVKPESDATQAYNTAAVCPGGAGGQ
jgi:hypothetical protein